MIDRLKDAAQLTNIEIAVLLSGTTSMGLEILAGRIIAPEFGSSIYTWGSIIGVFMAALSLGYYIGGRRSEEASRSQVATILLMTAGYVAFLLFTHESIVTILGTVPLPVRYASIPSIIVLFGPPVYILGLITPYAAELSSKQSKGEASGQVFAIGTVGSIAGTFLTTFFLIPWLTVDQIFLLFGSTLLLGSILLHRPRLWERGLFILIIAGFLLGGYALSGPSARLDGTTVHHTQTPYQELAVVDDGGVRTLYLNGQPNSAMYLNGSSQYVFSYTPYFHLPFLLRDDIEDVLFIGGGGFSGPTRFLEEYNVSVDVVEIDPQVVDAARTYFNVTDPPNMTTHVMDGREFLEGTENTYDLIILDAYKKDKVPFHLATEEFFQLAYGKLDDDGIVLSNIISARSGPGSRFFRAEYKTVQQVFPQVQAFATRDGSSVQNIEIIAWKGEQAPSTEEWLERNEERDIGIDLSSQIQFKLDNVKTDDVPLLTDDHAPVDRLLDPMLGQEYVISQ